MGVPIQSFRELEVWRQAVDLSVEIYQASRQFPKHETFGLASQMQRSSVSVAANVAEGHARQHTAEFVQFLSIARGSLAELLTHVIISRRLGYIPEATELELVGKIESVSRMLTRMQATLRTKMASGARNSI